MDRIRAGGRSAANRLPRLRRRLRRARTVRARVLRHPGDALHRRGRTPVRPGAGRPGPGPAEQRVVDFGAGNGLGGARLRAPGVGDLVGVDLEPWPARPPSAIAPGSTTTTWSATWGPGPRPELDRLRVYRPTAIVALSAVGVAMCRSPRSRAPWACWAPAASTPSPSRRRRDPRARTRDGLATGYPGYLHLRCRRDRAPGPPRLRAPLPGGRHRGPGHRLRGSHALTRRCGPGRGPGRAGARPPAGRWCSPAPPAPLDRHAVGDQRAFERLVLERAVAAHAADVAVGLGRQRHRGAAELPVLAGRAGRPGSASTSRWRRRWRRRRSAATPGGSAAASAGASSIRPPIARAPAAERRELGRHPVRRHRASRRRCRRSGRRRGSRAQAASMPSGGPARAAARAVEQMHGQPGVPARRRARPRPPVSSVQPSRTRITSYSAGARRAERPAPPGRRRCAPASSRAGTTTQQRSARLTAQGAPALHQLAAALVVLVAVVAEHADAASRRRRTRR